MVVSGRGAALARGDGPLSPASTISPIYKAVRTPPFPLNLPVALKQVSADSVWVGLAF